MPLVRQRRARSPGARTARGGGNLSSDRRLRIVRRGVRGALAELIGRNAAALLLASGAFFLLAATPPPKLPVGGNALTKAQMESMLPKVPLHTVYVVAINKLGQVTNAKAKTLSKNLTFNVQTYGNALQAFIRTSDGTAIPGLYTLSYEYEPKTRRIERTVALMHAGGVDANAKGAALVMMDAAKKQAEKEAALAAAKAKHPAPAPHASAGH
jgi:hypothetical protein